MSPDNSRTVNGLLIEQYYWNGKMITYIDNTKFDGTFSEAIEHCKSEALV